MNANDFCYWLQGFFELTDVKTVDEKQVEVIKEHLSLVFNKVTKSSITPPLGFTSLTPVDCSLTETKLC